MRRDEDEKPDKASLGLKDYLALFVALLQTLALPFLVLIVILVAFLVYSSVAR